MDVYTRYHGRGINMKVYVYIDESGSIHKNSKTRYFAVGGYFCFDIDRVKICSKYKKCNLKIKRKNGFDLSKEIKSYDMSKEEKIMIFDKIQDIHSFNGCVKIFDKNNMKDINDSNIFFNYAVKLLLVDCVLPIINTDDLDSNIEFVLSVDNRNISVKDLKNLQNYLKTEFCLNDYDFKVNYYDSASKYEIQLADLVVNTFYNRYKDYKLVDKVIESLRPLNFRISLFPGNKWNGRKDIITYYQK